MADIMERMMSMMMDKMAGKMSKDDMQEMMADMMTHMFADMDLADRISFMQAMMGVCIPKMTEGLNVAERDELASSILGRMAGEVKATTSSA